DGRHESRGGEARDHPRGLREADRGERGARLGRAVHGGGRDSLLLWRGRHLPANALTVAAEGARRQNLLGLPPDELGRFFESLGEKPYRARQIMRWVYQRRALDFDAMTDLSLPLRERL